MRNWWRMWWWPLQTTLHSESEKPPQHAKSYAEIIIETLKAYILQRTNTTDCNGNSRNSQHERRLLVQRESAWVIDCASKYCSFTQVRGCAPIMAMLVVTH